MERREYMRNDGFVLVTDVGHQFMRDTLGIPVTRLASVGEDWKSSEVNPSVGALGLVSQDLSSKLRRRGYDYNSSFKKTYGISREDLGPKNKFSFGEGLGDLDFTWHFAPAVANDVVQTFQQEGYISQERYAAMTLGDWADVIGSVWFSELMHDMALTSNGIYGSFGGQEFHYGKGALNNHLNNNLGHGLPTNHFEVVSRYEELTDQTFLTAKLSGEARQLLRSNMKSAASTGCPVARRAGTLPLSLVENDTHARQLVRRGDLLVTSRDDDKGKARFTQEYTPIDRALDGLAQSLDVYDGMYGTPYLRPTSPRTIMHAFKPKTNVLILPGDVPFVPLPLTNPDA